MSSFIIACPNAACGKPLNLPAAAVGQPLSCPHCKTGIAVTLGPDGQRAATAAVKARRGSAVAALGVVLALVLVPVAVYGGGLWWALQPPGREIGRYDLGHGRQVRLWSQGEVLDPVGVYYQITQNGRVVCPTTHIGVDHGEKFDFRTAFADNGQVACVYEVNRANDSDFFIIYDAERRTAWPRADNDYGRWRELYWKLLAANPDLPRVRYFER